MYIPTSEFKYSFKTRIFAFISSITCAVFLPFLHIGIIFKYWDPNKPKVDKRHCSCDCFDTVFRGKYEWPPSSYKHVYFNATLNTLWIWFIMIVGIVLIYESVTKIVKLIYYNKLRHNFLFIFVTAIYPHYYGWWCIFNYLNEDFYSQWFHQIFFSITELISTAIVLHLCDIRNKIESWKLLAIFSINIMHIIVGCWDQFVANIIYHKARDFEAIRDISLLMPDILHVLFPILELKDIAKKKKINFFNLFYKEELYMSILFVILFSLFGKLL